MPYSKTIVGLLLPLVFISEAAAQFTINSMLVVEDNYSEKTLEVEIDYDGSFGETVSVGAMPATERNTTRDGYAVHFVNKGVSKVNISLRRPATEDNETTVSWGVWFRFATFEGRRLLAITERMNLTWPGIREHFNISEEPQEILQSVRSIRINEALANTDDLISWMAARTNFIDAVQITNVNSTPPEPNLMPLNILRISEDVSFNDLSRVLQKIYELEIIITGVMFIPIDDPNFARGMIAINSEGYMSSLADLNFSPIDELVNLGSLEEMYAVRNFQPTPPEEFINFLLHRIIALNDQSSRTSSQQAQDLIELVLERDPDQPLAYVELARSLFRTESCCEQEAAAQNIMNIALNLFPDDAHVNHYAGYVEYERGELEKALVLFQLAEQQRDEEIIWLRINWGNTLLALGREEEAFEKFSPLLTLSVLNDSDSRAIFLGLRDYANALAENHRRNAGPIYARLLEDYPERARCIPVNYAEYILFAENDTNRARQMLGRGEQYSCDNISAINALVDIVAWYNDGNTGSRPALYSSFLKHPQVDELIYRLANSFDPAPILRALSENGVDLDQLGAYDTPAMQQAISDSNLYAIRSLAAAGANINDDMGEGFTPLLMAIFMEDLDVIRTLIEAGADPAVTTEFGMSALDLAEQSGDEELISALSAGSTNDV